MSEIFGINAFGLDDSVNGTPDRRIKNKPAVIIRGEDKSVITGSDAQKNRIHLGLHWPKEAQLPLEKNKITEELRRYPIAVLWQLLLKSKDNIYRKRIGRFYAEELLREHIDFLCPPKDNAERILTIPNRLSTSSQELLLRSFGFTRKSTQLLWRPVAAALAWLDELHASDFPRKKGWIGICYLGLDGFEFTPLELDFENPEYVVPVRSSPITLKDHDASGFDLAASDASLEKLDETLLWQVLLSNPCVWNSIKGEGNGTGQQILSDNHNWRLWDYQTDFRQYDYWTINSQWPVQKFFGLSRSSFSAFQCWGNYLKGLALVSFSSHSQKPCLGLILCGPLIPHSSNKMPEWIVKLANNFNLTTTQTTPQVNTLYLPSEDIISKGAQIYGERLANNKPTYLDTLPTISLFVTDNQSLKWKPLFERTTCKGGETETNTLNIFSLQPGESNLEVWLQMIEENTDIDTETNDLENTPYRFSKVLFQKTYPHPIQLTLTAKMRPSSGFARVFFTPADQQFKDILGDESYDGVLLDFDDMEKKLEKDLPVLKLRCPLHGEKELLTSLDIANNIYAGYSINQFRSDLSSPDLQDIALVLGKKQVITRTFNKKNQNIKAYLVNQKGESLVLSSRELDELKKLIIQRLPFDPNALKAASWLWRGCPTQAKTQIIQNARQKPIAANIGFASRVADSESEILTVMQIAHTSIQQHNGQMIPMVARALTWMMDFNPKGAIVLYQHQDMLHFLLNTCKKEILRQCKAITSAKTINGYQWPISLFCTLLKVRNAGIPDFLTSDKEIEEWKELIRYLKWDLEKYAKNPRARATAPRVQAILLPYYQDIQNYLEGCGNNVPILSEDVD
jgi:hypothetical protein